MGRSWHRAVMARPTHEPVTEIAINEIICPTAAYSTPSYEHPSAISREYVKLKSKAKFIFWLINFVSFNPLDMSK